MIILCDSGSRDILNGMQPLFPAGKPPLRQKHVPKGPGFGDIFKNIGTPKLKPVVSSHPPPKQAEPASNKLDPTKSVRPLAVQRVS